MVFVPSLALNEAMRGKPWIPRFPVTHGHSPQPSSPGSQMRVVVITWPFSQVGREHSESMARSRVDATHRQRSDHSGPTGCTGAKIPCLTEPEMHIFRSLKSELMYKS